jgi:hypothetical protein
MRHAVSPSFWPHAETVVSTESRSIGGVCCVPLAIATDDGAQENSGAQNS